MSQSSRRTAGLGRVAIYYVLLIGLLILAVRSIPVVQEVMSGAYGSGASEEFTELVGTDAPLPVGAPVSGSAWDQAIVALVSMLGALAIMIPVTWVYMITRRQRGYDESVIHTLLILPVAVTGIVMVVLGRLEIAFALAGIVAAVRFRTTLDDTKDAVYVFLAIGVGIASGVQEIGIALALSLVFNVVVLVLWSTRFGNIYADSQAGALGLGDVLAGPGSGVGALSVGDPSVLEAAAPADLAEIADRAARIERHVSEERAKKKRKRANALLLVHAASAEPAQAYVDAVLADLAARSKLAEVEAADRGVLLVYLARFDGAEVEGAVMDRLREAPDGVVDAAELRSLKGLKPRT
jgi:hypothetical protein